MNEMSKKTTCEMNCQNYRGGRLPRRHVSAAATARGRTFWDGISKWNNKLGGAYRHVAWRHADVATCRLEVRRHLAATLLELRRKEMKGHWHGSKKSMHPRDVRQRQCVHA